MKKLLLLTFVGLCAVTTLWSSGGPANGFDGLATDTLYWKSYYYNYLQRSPEGTSPVPANRTPFTWLNNQTVVGMDPAGNYVYEAYNYTIRRHDPIDGSYVDFPIPYPTTGACGTNGSFIFVQNGATIYKYTMTGSYVNQTQVNVAGQQYGFSVANDTVWINADVAGYSYYAYACSRFVGGSITQNRIWTTGGLIHAAANLTFDGTYYDLCGAGSPSTQFKRFRSNGTLYATGTAAIDARGVMAVGRRYLRDVGVVRVSSPAPACSLGTYTPSVRVKNLGGLVSLAPFYVKFSATGPGSHRDSALCPILAAGAETTVTFAPWTISAAGSYTISCSSQSAVDSLRANDKLTTTFRAGTIRCLVIHAENLSYVKGLVDTLHKYYGQDLQLDTFNAGTGGGSPHTDLNVNWALARGYRAILTFAGGYNYYNASRLGESLAAYLERGGDNVGVVWAVNGTAANLGRFSSVYAPTPTGGYTGSGTIGTIHRSGHPVLDCVSSVVMGYYTSSVTSLAGHPTAYRIADWYGGSRVLAAANDTANRRIVTLGLQPTTMYTASVGDSWRRLIRNSLLWCAGRHDVSVTRLVAPGGTIDSGTTVVPRCSVYNYGYQTETYSVRMRIGTGYEQTVTVNGHVPGARLYLTFPTWTALERGNLGVACSTGLAGDVLDNNDVQTGEVDVLAHDAAVTTILTPPAALDSGTVVTPACSVANYGNGDESYRVRLKIGAGYEQTVAIAGHAGGTVLRVTFPDWTALPRGNLGVSCSTELAVDGIRANDRRTGTVAVAVHDLGIAAIVAPSGLIPPGPMTPKVRLHNSGTARESAAVALAFDCTPPYRVVLSLPSGLPSGVDTVVEFTDWSAASGDYVASCTVFLAGDQLPENNTAGLAFSVAGVDAGVEGISAPQGDIDSALAIVPVATFRNFGGLPATFKAFAQIYPFYEDSVDVVGLPADSARTVVFDTWLKPHQPGGYRIRCRTALAGDARPVNDTLSLRFTITSLAPDTGWVRQPDVPLGVKGKKVKDGGCLAANANDQSDTALVFALKGNNRYEFYGYNTVHSEWTTRESIPAVGRAGKKKAVKKGAAMAAAGGVVYAAKGNGTVEFWGYSPADRFDRAYPWSQLADVPLGAKALKEGAGAAAVKIGDTTYVYLLKGSATQEFYRYNTVSNAWESRASAPLGASGKPFKNGSALTAGSSGRTLFALKGSYNEFFAYSVESNAWTTQAMLPLVGSSGRKKKVKDGAGLAPYGSVIYALKGGNTNEFWKYVADSDKWVTQPDIPAGSGRNVKGGGALAYYARPFPALYALKGNNSLDLFRYGFAAMTNDQAPMTNAGAAAQAQASSANFALRISPNPFTTTTTVAYSLSRAGKMSLELYDITGKLVTTLAEGRFPAGRQTYRLERSVPASGVYLVRLTTETGIQTAKLIVD